MVTKGKKLPPKVKCISCDNNLVKIYLAESGGNKKPFGLFCVHCDFPRQPENWFLELKHDKIIKTEERKLHHNFTNKTHCGYCGGTNYKKKKDKFIFHQTPIYEKDGKTVKKYLEKKINKIMSYQCNNPKCRAETHMGKWSVNQSLV